MSNKLFESIMVLYFELYKISGKKKEENSTYCNIIGLFQIFSFEHGV